MPIAETRVPVMLDRERFLCFDLNGMCAYEDATGKFFLDTVAALHDAVKPIVEAQKDGKVITDIEIARRVPVKDLRALIWAAVHEYDKQGEPVWPLTLAQVGKIIKPKPKAIVALLLAFLSGYNANSPDTEEMGESQAPSATAVNGAAKEPNPQHSVVAAGGGDSIVLPEDAFA